MVVLSQLYDGFSGDNLQFPMAISPDVGAFVVLGTLYLHKAQPDFMGTEYLHQRLPISSLSTNCFTWDWSSSNRPDTHSSVSSYSIEFCPNGRFLALQLHLTKHRGRTLTVLEFSEEKDGEVGASVSIVQLGSLDHKPRSEFRNVTFHPVLALIGFLNRDSEIVLWQFTRGKTSSHV